MAVDSEWHAEGGKSKRVGDTVWVALPRKPLQWPPPLSLRWRGTLRHSRNVPLEETSSGLGSMEPGNDTSKVQCSRSYFLHPTYRNRFLPSVWVSCLVLPGHPHLFALCTTAKHTQQPSHIGVAASLLGSGRGGDGTFSAARCELPRMENAKKGADEIPVAGRALEFLTRAGTTLPGFGNFEVREHQADGGGQTGLSNYILDTSRPIGHLAASMSRCLSRPPVSPTHPFSKEGTCLTCRRTSTAPRPNMPHSRHRTEGYRSLRTSQAPWLQLAKMPQGQPPEASSTHDLGAYNEGYVLSKYWDSGLPFTARPCHVGVGSASILFRPSGHPRGLPDTCGLLQYSFEEGAQCPSFLRGPRCGRWRSTMIVGSGTRRSTPAGRRQASSLTPG